ncbi:MAG TPA: hypothetical protein VIU64_09215 [Polyangia bacterium]
MKGTRGLVSLALLAIAGCGPTISESRLAFYRARGDDCDLGFVQPNGSGKPLGDKWVVIGYVSVDGVGKGDPLTSKNRELVRGRICEMGGTAVAVAVPGMSDTSFNTDADVTFAALRPAIQPAPELAQKF